MSVLIVSQIKFKRSSFRPVSYRAKFVFWHVSMYIKRKPTKEIHSTTKNNKYFWHFFFFFTLFLPYSLLYFKAKLMHGMVKQGNFRNTKEWHHPMVVFSRTFFPSDLCHWQVHPIFWLTLTSFLSVEIPTIIIFSKNFMEGGREKKTLIDHVFFFFF